MTFTAPRSTSSPSTSKSPGPGVGRPVSRGAFSGSIPKGRAGPIRIFDFDTGDSVLPDAGGASGTLVHFPPVEFDVGELRD
jgi:hypothetical protein